MKLNPLSLAAAFCTFVASLAGATQADDATITIDSQTQGSTPFISQLTLTASDITTIKSIRFEITPKRPSVTRPLSGTYSSDYLTSRGDLDSATGQIFLPVYGLYSGFANPVTLTYYFQDGSSKQASTIITTAVFDDPCGYNRPASLQHRTADTSLSYDYIMMKGTCSGYSPAIIDTDGALRWMAVTAPNFLSFSNAFFDNAVLYVHGAQLFRLDLDGTFTQVADYSGAGVNNFHHNIDLGKTGIILEADTPEYVESVFMEVDTAGVLLKTWNMADIISAAMIAGGDDPSQFVRPSPTDWFHNNAVTYNRADDSLIVSSRESFLICIDYETSAIKWIYGDQTKHWYQFPSLAQYAINLAPGTLPPIGQHAGSITFDQNVMVFDNGFASFFQHPVGASRPYASPRKYRLDLANNLATEVWNDEMDQSIFSPICGSVYEDGPYSYLIDYADINGFNAPQQFARLDGLTPAGDTAFSYQYPTQACSTAFNSVPLHLESTSFPTVTARALNFSSRGAVGSGDSSLIGGFIITGDTPVTLILRALGPSLAGFEVSGPLANPTLALYDSLAHVIATNDDWQNDAGAAQISAEGLAPSDALESATLQTLSPGAYTFVITGVGGASGIGLVEAYNLSPLASSRLANLSTRTFIGAGENALISGFIIGQVDSNSVAIRALGPSLSTHGVSSPLSDPTLTVYEANGTAIATNDNWQDDPCVLDLQKNGLAPTNSLESATILKLPAGAYTVVVTGADGGSGVGLIEVYDLR